MYDIEQEKTWIENAKKNNYPYIVVMTDTFDFEDYPIYCHTKEEAEKYKFHNENMQRFNKTIEVK